MLMAFAYTFVDLLEGKGESPCVFCINTKVLILPDKSPCVFCIIKKAIHQIFIEQAIHKSCLHTGNSYIWWPCVFKQLTQLLVDPDNPCVIIDSVEVFQSLWSGFLLTTFGGYWDFLSNGPLKGRIQDSENKRGRVSKLPHSPKIIALHELHLDFIFH